jgi:hypothetical protein
MGDPYLDRHNRKPEPFIWASAPECIIETVNPGTT